MRGAMSTEHMTSAIRHLGDTLEVRDQHRRHWFQYHTHRQNETIHIPPYLSTKAQVSKVVGVRMLSNRLPPVNLTFAPKCANFSSLAQSDTSVLLLLAEGTLFVEKCCSKQKFTENLGHVQNAQNCCVCRYAGRKPKYGRTSLIQA